MTPFPKYSAITEKPSFELFTCWKNRSWSLEFCSKPLFISITALYSGAHSGHSFSLSPRQRWWKECIHIKCTAGRSRVKVQAVHLLSWKILAFVLRSWISFLIANVSSCTISTPTSIKNILKIVVRYKWLHRAIFYNKNVQEKTLRILNDDSYSHQENKHCPVSEL